jgi:hypothetical protein
MKTRIARRSPAIIPELKAVLQEEWYNLDQTMLDELVVSMPRRFRMCIEEHRKTICRRVRNLHPFAIPKGPNFPLGLMRIHDLSLICVRHAIHIAARVRETHSSESVNAIHSTREDRKSLTPPGELTGRIGRLVFGDALGVFTIGAAVVIFARVLAALSSLTNHDALGERRSLPLQMCVSFDSHDIEHEREIADSDSRPSLSGVSGEQTGAIKPPMVSISSFWVQNDRCDNHRMAHDIIICFI